MTTIDRYTCEEVVRRLDDYVDRELAPHEMQLMRQHIETCAACAKEYAFAEGTLRTIKAKLRRIEVPGDLIAHVALRLAELTSDDEEEQAS
jgi:anti-sigma factor (TIGR02949 family)